MTFKSILSPITTDMAECKMFWAFIIRTKIGQSIKKKTTFDLEYRFKVEFKVKIKRSLGKLQLLSDNFSSYSPGWITMGHSVYHGITLLVYWINSVFSCTVLNRTFFGVQGIMIVSSAYRTLMTLSFGVSVPTAIHFNVFPPFNSARVN